MNGINDWGINQLLQRRLNITDNPAPASTLAPEVMPVMSVLPDSPDMQFLRGTRLCAAATTVAALAANYSVITLSNPAGSGIIVNVDRVTINGGTAGSFVEAYLEEVSLPSLGTLGSAVLDNRWGMPTRRTQAVFAGGNTATAPNIAWIWFARYAQAGAYPPVQYDIPLVIVPGGMLIFYTSAVNLPIGITLFWRERPAQPSELA